ncbi:MAG: hypothetical protein MT334_05625 [Candidatus Nitrosopumilus limneticus]|nr:hypothetical protein [Candidatus Nitrosopumilus limneticus]MDA0669475.1 hypothetical protein [Thermoproteota archaeon]PHY04133.1 MAG: hypothetical protein CK526_04075 [Nitrososphaerota archaeon]HJJ21315.1 hypothetical protein [Nitrosopumilus sp.]MDA0853366.1 hypothetical protein [Thermoproteota archaeon]
MKSVKKKSIIILILLLLSIFGYSQFQLVSQISVSISENAINNEDDSNKKIELKFTNPSLLTLPAGETEFFVFYDDEIVGKGNLESFTLYPISSVYVEGTFTTNSNSDESKSVKISGITKYDLLFTTIEVPFDYYPTKEQTRKFIE